MLAVRQVHMHVAADVSPRSNASRPLTYYSALARERIQRVKSAEGT
jgi:hypothetical protein